jgi:hypothetical protein
METQNNWLLDARKLVHGHLISKTSPDDTFRLRLENVYVDDFTHIGTTRKVIVRTDVPDGLHYEVVRDDAKGMTWLTIYKLVTNIPIKD